MTNINSLVLVCSLLLYLADQVEVLRLVDVLREELRSGDHG